jgi:hypothetical protein
MRGYPDTIGPMGTEALPLFRKTDPQTSADAAKSMRTQAGVQRALILAHMRACPYQDHNGDELDQHLGFRPTTAGRRLPELRRLGLVEVTGETRETRSHRQAECYRLSLTGLLVR